MKQAVIAVQDSNVATHLLKEAHLRASKILPAPMFPDPFTASLLGRGCACQKNIDALTCESPNLLENGTKKENIRN